jgi:hypothetical protein
MKARKLFMFAVAFTLLAILSVGAMAQGTTRQKAMFSLPPEPILPTVKVNAIEVTDGTLGMDYQDNTETMFGYTFLGRTTGSFPGSLTLSMNCTPAYAVAGSSTELKGGSWTLPVYMTSERGTVYAGSLYGTISKGSMNWEKAETSLNASGAVVDFLLNVDGGTQTWEGVTGYATFTGILFFDEKTQKTTLSGDLVFNIINK